MEKRKDFSKDSFLRAHEEPPVVSVRLNPSKPMPEEALWPGRRPIPWNPDGFYLPERPAFIFDPYLHAGCYYVQEASSMFIGEILRQVHAPEASRVLDLCAAPGGKSTLLASCFPEGLVVSNEVIKTRASILAENATKWGTGNIIVTNNDPRQFGQFPGYFDVMLVDAPCSGSGLFRKETEWREGWSAENVQLCSQRQKRILADAFATLKEGGLLIYSTCSFSHEEDEDIADWLMDNYQLENIALDIPASWGVEETISERHGCKSYRFYPGKIEGEGFFAAVFRKSAPAGFPYGSDAVLSIPSKKEDQLLQAWLANRPELLIYKIGDSFHAIDSRFEQDLKMLKGRFYLKKGGTELGMIKGKDLIPSIELALSHLVAADVQTYNLDTDAALDFLRKSEVERTDAMQNGWTLACYHDRPLGWLKVLPNRINNYYPMEWRIRKQ